MCTMSQTDHISAQDFVQKTQQKKQSLQNAVHTQLCMAIIQKSSKS